MTSALIIDVVEAISDAFHSAEEGDLFSTATDTLLVQTEDIVIAALMLLAMWCSTLIVIVVAAMRVAACRRVRIFNPNGCFLRRRCAKEASAG